MLLTIGSILAGVLLYDHIMREQTRDSTSALQASEAKQLVKEEGALTVIYHMKSGEGEISLPLCRLMAVELGPSTDPNKATLQIVVNKSIETECKPVTDIEKEKKYVKPTQYQTNIVLKMKKKGKVPITAYYIAHDHFFITRWVKKKLCGFFWRRFLLCFSIIHMFSYDRHSTYKPYEWNVGCYVPEYVFQISLYHFM